MVTVYTAQNIIDAHLVKGLLESEGIPALVSGADLQGGIGELPAIGFVTVGVAERLAGAARAIIEGWENADPDLENGDGSGQNKPLP